MMMNAAAAPKASGRSTRRGTPKNVWLPRVISRAPIATPWVMISSPSEAIAAEAPISRAIALPLSAAKTSPASATTGNAPHSDNSCPARKAGNSGKALRWIAAGMVRMPDRYAPIAMKAPCPKDTIPVLPQNTASATTAATLTHIWTAIRSPARPKTSVSTATTTPSTTRQTAVRVTFAARSRAGWVRSAASLMRKSRRYAGLASYGQLVQQVLRGDLPAIALDRAQRMVVTLLRIGQAGVCDLRDQITEVTGVADRAFDALIGNQPAHHHLFDAQVTQHVIDMRGHEDRGGRFGKHDLVVTRGALVDHLAVPRSLGHVEPGDLVIEAAVTPVLGQAFDGGIKHLDPRLATPGLQALHVGHDPCLKLIEEPAVGVVERVFGQVLEFRPIPLGAEILDVDEQKRRLIGHKGHVARQDGLGGFRHVVHSSV